MGNKERSQKKINAFFGISMVDLDNVNKTINAHFIIQNLVQRKKSKNSIKKFLKIRVFQLFSIRKFPGHERTYF
jgi:hypothetical protein